MLGVDPQREPSIVLDLSVASPLLDGDPRENAEPLLTQRVFDAMRDAERAACRSAATTSRGCSTSHPAFALGAGPTDEHRTIHIGLDLFAPRGHAGVRAARRRRARVRRQPRSRRTTVR